MEARDSGSRIRPLPIDDIDGGQPQHRPIEPKRRWASLIVIVLGALAFGVIARGLGVGTDTQVGSATTVPPASLAETPSATSTTTTEPAPSTLLDMLPAATEGLQLITVTSSSARVGTWEPEAIAPVFATTAPQPLAASYNTTGTRTAIHSSARGGSFVIYSDDSISPAHLTGAVTSVAWHSANPNLMAWTAEDEDNAATTISVADISGDTSAGVSPLVALTVAGDRHTLRTWGDWGFATTRDGMVYGFDPDGFEVRTYEGAYFDAAPDGTLLLGDVDDEGTAPFLLSPDGERVDLPSLDIGADDFRITDDGQWVLAVTIQQEGHTSILGRTVYSRSTRLTSIDETARVVNTARAGRFLVLQEIATGDLIFKDWNTGAEHRVPAGEEVADIFLPS
jgi:hypothetical protein